MTASTLPSIRPSSDKPSIHFRVCRVIRLVTHHASLGHFILLATGLGLLIGGLGGESVAQPGYLMAQVFLRAVNSLIVPLIFSTLVVGIAGHGDDVGSVGRMIVKCLAYFWTITTFSLFIGLGAVNLIRPGDGTPIIKRGQLPPQADISVEGFIKKLIPESFFHAAAENQTLGIVVSAIAFSIALLWVKRAQRKVMVDFLGSLMDVMFQVTWIVMLLAPLGVMGALMNVIGKNGFMILLNLGKLVATLYGGLVVLVLLVFVPVVKLCGVGLGEFFGGIRKPVTLAFLTSSSESALPMAMEIMMDMGCPRDIVALVMPLGYTFNLDGTTLYLAIAACFCAQLGEMDLDFGTQIVMMLTLMLVSKGVAAVPRASFVVLVSTVSTFGLPTDGILVIAGVDPFLDMVRTAINLTGNCLACIVLSQWEGRFRTDPVVADRPRSCLQQHEEDELNLEKGVVLRPVSVPYLDAHGTRISTASLPL